jgi:hypothetical protein
MRSNVYSCPLLGKRFGGYALEEAAFSELVPSFALAVLTIAASVRQISRTRTGSCLA